LKKGSSDRGGPLCHCVTSPRTAGSHPQTPFLKLSVLNFSQIGRTHVILHGLFYFRAPYLGKIKIKSLWKGVRGRTFPQKGFPRVADIYCYISTALKERLFFSRTNIFQPIRLQNSTISSVLAATSPLYSTEHNPRLPQHLISRCP